MLTRSDSLRLATFPVGQLLQVGLSYLEHVRSGRQGLGLPRRGPRKGSDPLSSAGNLHLAFMDRWAELLLTVGGQGLSLAAGGGPAAPVEPDTCLGRGTEGRAQSLQGVGGVGE